MWNARRSSCPKRVTDGNLFETLIFLCVLQEGSVWGISLLCAQV